MGDLRSEWTVLSMLNWATGYFEKREIQNPRLSIEWILAHVLNKKRLDLYLLFDRPLTVPELDAIRPLVKRRAHHEPIQYITGETDFFGYPFRVRPGVLIPRPETEQLVELLLNTLSPDVHQHVLDIGTGSGCIPITIKKEREHWSITGIDISDEALLIAKENSGLNSTEVTFLKDDFISPSSNLLDQRFNAIISNPPYILESEKKNIDQEVKAYEPEVALFTDSFEKVYSAIEQFASRTLVKKGILVLEINERLGPETLALFDQQKWETSLIKDYSDKDRFILAKKCF